MKWIMDKPRYGDIIRIRINNIYHYGIYVSDEEVIQFGLPPIDKNTLLAENIKVLSTNIDEFLVNEFLEVNVLDSFEKSKAKSADEVVSLARSMIGTGGYHLLYNNCEHFVYLCKFGEKKSPQVDEVRGFMSKMFEVNVFAAKVPKNEELNEIKQEFRINELNEISNESLKKEKTFIWNVLEYALKEVYNLNINDLDMHKNEFGKLVCNSCEISFSHSKGLVVVALSKSPIGVDVEYDLKLDEKVINKIFNSDEQQIISKAKNKGLIFTSIWTRKESIFKRLNEKSFLPNKIDTTIEPVKSYVVSLEKNCIISLSSLFLDNVNLYKLKYHNHLFSKAILKSKEI